jgi:RNA polymerase sigma-70 factor, ECF subfamily
VSATSEMERLYREHGGRLWRSLFAFSGDREVASDAVAEAFAQALRRGTALRDPLAWTWRAAFRIARGELKRRRDPGMPGPSSSYEMPEPALEVVRALGRLSPSQRAAVVLHHVADRPVREVAGTMGTSPAAVRVHLSRGRRRLRELLKEERDD